LNLKKNELKMKLKITELMKALHLNYSRRSYFFVFLLITNLLFIKAGFSQGDNCSTALTLTNVTNFCSSPTGYTNVGSTASSFSILPCWTPATSTEDVWFSFTAVGSDVLISVSGNGFGGTMMSPHIGLMTGLCTGTMNVLGCANGTTGSGYTQLYVAGLQLGVTYYIRISTTQVQEGTFQLCVNNYDPPLSAGADCAGAAVLCNKNGFSVGSLSGGGANADEPEASTCMEQLLVNDETNSVWYTWTCASSGTLLFDLTPSNPTSDIDFLLYQLNTTNPCGTRTAIRCNASSCLNAVGSTGLNATDIDVSETPGCAPGQNAYCQQVTMTAGTSYALLINNANGSSGFNVSWGGTGTFVGPDANIVASATTVCAGSDITFNGSTSTGYNSLTWTFNNTIPTTTLTGVGTHTITFPNPGNYTAILEAVSATGCSSIEFKNITVNPSPTVTVNSGTICAGSSTVLTVSGGTTYSWTPGTNLTSTTGSVVTANPTVTTTYSVTGTTNGCSNTKTVSVNVNPIPTTTASTTGTLTCTNSLVALNSTLAGVNYTWTPPAGGSVGSANTQSTSVMGIPGTYTLNVSTAAGCTYSTTTIVTQNTVAPVVVGSISGTLSCTTLTVNASATTTMTPVSYTWSGTGIVSGNGTGTISVIQPGTFNYTVTNTSNGCITTGSEVITQNTVAPTVTVTPTTQTITCAAPTVTLTGSATPSNCTTVWTGGVSSGSNSFTATASSANIYTLTVTNPVNGCVKSATTQVIPSAGIPSVTISVTNSLSCTTSTAQVVVTTTTSPVSYNWTGPGITGGATTASATVNAAGQYTVVVTNTASACSTTITVSVIQNTTTPVAVGANTGTLTCTTLTVNASATTTTTPVSYNWTGIGITSATNISIITVNQPGTFNYTVTNTSNNCKTTGSQTIVQNTVSPTVVGATSGMLTCTTLTVNVSATTTTTPVSYNWAGTGITAGTGTGTVTVNQPGTFNYTVTNTSNGCKTTGSQTVIQNTVAPSGLSAGSNQTMTCASPSVTLNGSVSSPTNAIANWSGTNVCGTVSNFTTQVCAAGIYTLQATNPSNGCVSTSTVEVFANPGAPTATLSVSSVTVDCNNPIRTVSVTVTPTNDITFNWSPTPASGVNSSVASFTNQGTYICTITNTLSSCSTSTQVVVTTNTVIPVINISGTQTLTCSTPTAVISTTATPVVTYTWSGAFVSGQSTDAVLVNQSGDYTVTVTGANGCTNTASAHIETDQTPPSATISVTSTNTVITCLNPSVTLSVGATPAGTYSYSWSGGSNNSTQNVSTSGVYTATVLNTTSGCTTTAQFTVTNNITPPTISVTDYTIPCNSTSIIIGATASNVSYNWTTLNGSILSGANTASPVAGSTGQYVVTVTDNTNGCTNSGTVTVSQNTITTTISATPISGTVPLSVDFSNTSAGGINYSWDFGDTNNNSSNASNPNHVYNSAGNYVVVFTVTDPSGLCSATATISIEVLENSILIIPNVFTPNGDNSNDLFKITATGIKTLTCDIFNRWGQKLYTIKAPEDVWDGKAAGTDVPDGTYFFILKAVGDDGKEYNQQNYINLFR